MFICSSADLSLEILSWAQEEGFLDAHYLHFVSDESQQKLRFISLLLLYWFTPTVNNCKGTIQITSHEPIHFFGSDRSPTSQDVH